MMKDVTVFFVKYLTSCHFLLFSKSSCISLSQLELALQFRATCLSPAWSLWLFWWIFTILQESWRHLTAAVLQNTGKDWVFLKLLPQLRRSIKDNTHYTIMKFPIFLFIPGQHRFNNCCKLNEIMAWTRQIITLVFNWMPYLNINCSIMTYRG